MPKGEVVPVPILCTVTFGAPLARIDGERQARVSRARARGGRRVAAGGVMSAQGRPKAEYRSAQHGGAR